MPCSIQRMKGLAALERLADADRRRVRILDLMREALGQVRLDTKYLCFDLEATRRERDELKSRLEGPNGY
jgi:hypothetical protein